MDSEFIDSEAKLGFKKFPAQPTAYFSTPTDMRIFRKIFIALIDRQWRTYYLPRPMDSEFIDSEAKLEFKKFSA